ncbi:MAG: S8 family serine peptidase [Actinomycetota bacterium]|nr:S8 family serine peptidase [Actinomycetota bacterium]
MSADLTAIKAIAARSDVVKITPIVPKTIDNAGAAQFTRVLDTWQSEGLFGDGVRVGIIDTGIDYTHADFGGPGTTAAYQAAKAKDAGPWTTTAKVVGGTDFVGDDYNADSSSPAYQPVPHPDPNPLDCNSHGTHVAGTAAGFGENADGSTFGGDYSTLNSSSLYSMKIGPGMAPDASLYALKVFGCAGSTDVVGEALDWALDPNGDGDFSDHLDIVNLSLGSDFGTEDDPENAMIDVLAENGVLPVIAMGNGGDVTDVGGTPGNAVRSLAVASVVDPFQLRDGIKVDAPADLAGIYAGQNSVAYDWANKAPVSGDVVAIAGSNADGCDPLSTADAASVKGKVAWLEWDDNDTTRRCGSVARSGNVAAAGAIGSIFTSQLDAFNAGITGSKDIPVFQLGAKETTKLRPALDAGTLKVTFDGSLAASIKDVSPSIGDTISSFSSRGTHGAINPVKPDVAAPGSTIASAGMGSGDGVLIDSGTSMATPHTAGIAALVLQQHPAWTPEQIKAAVMNTADHDVYSGPSHTGDKFGPARVGAGRVDALDATTTNVIAYNTNIPGGVSATFGVVHVPANRKSMSKTQTIKVQNTARTGANYKVAYQGVVNSPGIAYTVSPKTVYLPPNGSAKVTVTMTITTKDLDHTIDPTMTVTTVNPLTGLDEPRQFETDASGRVLLTTTGKPALLVPVFGVAKPYSVTTATKGTYRGQQALLYNGTGVKGGYTSLTSVLTLGAQSGKLPSCSSKIISGCVSDQSERAGDIKNIGVGSVRGPTSYADGYLYFGINTFADWATIGHSIEPYVDIDVNNDGKPDYEVYGQFLNVSATQSTDLLEAVLVDLKSGDALSVTPVNFNYGDVETGAFDSDTILLPVDPAAIGIQPTTKSFPIRYTAGTFNSFSGSDIDTVQGATFNVTKPAISVDEPLYIDAGKTAVPYTLAADAPKGTTAMVVHLNGKPGKRVDLVPVN